MNLAEQFTLLAYSDDGTPETEATRLDHGLGGAVRSNHNSKIAGDVTPA